MLLYTANKVGKPQRRDCCYSELPAQALSCCTHNFSNRLGPHKCTVELPERLTMDSDEPYAAGKRWTRSFMAWMTGLEQVEKKEVRNVTMVLACFGAEGQDVFETFDLPDDVSWDTYRAETF